MADTAHALQRASARLPELRKATVHAHISAKDPQCRASLAANLLHPCVRDRHTSLRLAHIGPHTRVSRGAVSADRHVPPGLLQRVAKPQWFACGSHNQPSQFRERPADTATLNLNFGLQSAQLHVEGVALNGGRGPGVHACGNQVALPACHLGYLRQDVQQTCPCKDGAVRRTDLGRQAPLAVHQTQFDDAELPISDSHPCCAPSQLQGPLDAGHRLGIHARGRIATLDHHLRVGPQAGLPAHAACRVDAAARLVQRGCPGQRPLHRLVDAHPRQHVHKLRGRCKCGSLSTCQCGTQRHDRHDHDETNRPGLHCTPPSKVAEPFPAGPSHSITHCHAPAIPNSPVTA